MKTGKLKASPKTTHVRSIAVAGESLGAPDFQANTAARLAEIFAQQRFGAAPAFAGCNSGNLADTFLLSSAEDAQMRIALMMPPQLARAKRPKRTTPRPLVETLHRIDIDDLCRWRVFPSQYDWHKAHLLEAPFRYPFVKSLVI
jgi:hypothetical protein